MSSNCSFKIWIKKMLLWIDTPLNYSCFGRKLFMRNCWMLQTMFFHICKQKTIDNCTWNLSLKFIEVRIFCYLIPVTGKNMIFWFYAYVEHIEIKTKTVNIVVYCKVEGRLFCIFIRWRRSEHVPCDCQTIIVMT